MRKINLVLIGFMLLAGVAAAQTKPTAQKNDAQKFDKWEVYAGYNFERSFGDLNFYSETSATKYNMYSPFSSNGGQLSAAYFPWKHIGFKTAFTYAGKSAGISGESGYVLNTITRSYLIGPTVRWTVPGLYQNRVSVFGQQLFGATHYSMGASYKGQPDGCNVNDQSCRASGFTEVTGGGVDLRVNRYISVRPLELDYWNHQINYVHFSGMPYEVGEENFNIAANGFRYSAGVTVHF